MTSTASGREILELLLVLTPEPAPDATAELLLEAFETIIARRAEVIAQIVPPMALSEVDRPLLAELERRQVAWQDALAQALRTVGEQRCGNSHLRAYAQHG